MSPVEGTPFGRYRLIALLGRGGMGEVWRAHDTVTDRAVAIKVLAPSLSDDADFQQRFRREAHAAARLETPHVVPIYDYGDIDGRLFVSMRLINGRSLATALSEGPLEAARAVRIVEQVAEALQAAHGIGLIHRDIKPSNILLDDRDFAYLIDFGIAKSTDDTRITRTGNTIGTFAYIAPERLGGEGDEDARVDIYSLACVLYEALTGKPPFAGDTPPSLIAAHLISPPPRPSATRSDIPAGVDEVIATGMAKEPDLRYATPIELADAARDAVTGPTPVTPPASPAPDPDPPPPSAPRRTKLRRGPIAVAILGAAALLIVGLYVGLSDSSKSTTSAPSSATSAPSASQTLTTPTASDRAGQTALTILDDVVRGDYVAATASFDSQLRQKISPQLLADSCKSYQQTLGAYQSHGAPEQLPNGDYTEVIVALQMKQEPGQFLVTFNRDGTVAGLFFLRAGVTPWR